MSLPTAQQAWAGVAATWPAASERSLGPFTLRDGAGGGNRVSAATADGPFGAEDIQAASDAMRAEGRDPIFWVRPGEDALDQALDAMRYDAFAQTHILAAPLDALAERDLPRLAAIPTAEPLAAMAEVWAEGGIGPARLAVMDRAPEPKITFLGRRSDHVAGAAFAAIHDGVLYVHALEVHAAFRRQGLARDLMVGAAKWGRSQEATTVAVAVTVENKGAQALYTSLGLTIVGGYHYRKGR